MDNFHFDMKSEGAERLKKALCLFSPPGGRVVGYSVDGKTRLVLYWHASPAADYRPLPFPMTLEQAADLAVGWLEHADYGKKPGHDGSNDKGWRLYCEAWGQVDGDSYAFAALEPAWAMYGK